MRKLKGGRTKESRKEKQERKKEMVKIRQQISTVVLPVLGTVFILIMLYVYLKTRPSGVVPPPSD